MDMATSFENPTMNYEENNRNKCDYNVTETLDMENLTDKTSETDAPNVDNTLDDKTNSFDKDVDNSTNRSYTGTYEKLSNNGPKDEKVYDEIGRYGFRKYIKQLKPTKKLIVLMALALTVFVFSLIAVILVAIPKATDESCNSALTSDLRDDQFWASSEYNTKHNASAARQNGEGWRASRSGSNYLKVDLESVWELTSLDVQGIGWYPWTFRISYSTDGYIWTGYNTRLSDDALGELFERRGTTITEVTFDPTIKARYIAINTVTNHGYASLRIELYGCQSTDTSTPVFTNVRNDIEVNTTWIPSQSPILIDGPVAIRSSTVLTIQAGVNVIFTTESARMDIYGSLSVEGIKGLAATFSSNHPVLSARSKWQGVIQGAGGAINMTHVLIRQALTGVQGNGSSVKLAYSEIHSCEYGARLSGGIARNVSIADTLQTDYMILTNVNVHDNTYGLAVHADTSKPDVPMEYLKFDRNAYGVSVTNWTKTNTNFIKTNLYIINCSMSNNSEYGIVSTEGILSNFYIRNSSFVGNRQAGFYYYRYNPSLTKETLNISNSYFIENRNDGLRVYCRNCEPTAHVFQNNSFHGHTQKAMEVTLIMCSTKETTNITIRNSIFENNRRDILMNLQKNGRAFIQNNYFAKSQMPVKLTSGDVNSNFAQMSGNIFTEHASVYDFSVIELDGISTNITNSTFANSSIQTLIKFNKGYNHTFEFNRFVNTSMTSCYLLLEQEYDPINTLTIDNNYWGTSDMLTIKSRICDFFLDSNKVIAELNKFFPTIMLETPSPAFEIDNFRFEKDAALNATIIGGIIKNSLDLTSLSDDRFIVNRSLLIAVSAALNITDSTIYFTNGRGIAVHGSLTVGNGENNSGRSILRAQANGRWNGIDLHSEDITMNNMDLFETKKFLSVHRTNTNIIFKNCNATDYVLEHLIHADMVNGNLSISIRNSSVKSRSSTLYIKAYDTRKIDLKMIDSQFSSMSCVIELIESTARYDLRYVNVNISNCSMYSGGNKTLYLSSCSSHLAGTITGSNFSSYYYYGTALFQSPSMDLNITSNNFGNARDILYFQFCNQPKEAAIHSKVIIITGNIFNSSRNGIDIVFYKHYTNEESHAIFVDSNVFWCKEVKCTTRRRINSYGYVRTYDPKHSLVVDSNLISNSADRAIRLTTGYDSIIIKNNTFANNTQCIFCIYISNPQLMNTVNITKNVFMNNTLKDWVIYLDTISNNNTTIIDNSFVNNTNTVIAFRSPNTTIRHNFFENGEDVYNLLVLPEDKHSDKIVNASLNFWGTTGVKGIAKTIYDKDYNENLFDIVIRPYLGSRNITDIQDEEKSFVTPDGEIGGVVNGEVTLKFDQSPYLVVSNVEVEETDTLTVDAGVVLIVKAGVGIKVNGEMNIFGTEENPVQMLSEVTGIPWRGIDIRTIKDCTIYNLYLNDTQEGLKIKISTVYIQNITSTHARQSGISVDVQDYIGQTNVRMSDVVVEKNGWDGVRVTGESENVVKVTVEKCRIANNVQYGINVETNAEVHFRNCVIRNNAKSGIYLKQSGSGILYINNSVITNNSKTALTGQISGGIVINSSSITKHKYGYFTKWGYWTTNSYISLTTANSDVEDTLVEFHNTSFTDNIADGIYISKSYNSNNKVSINIEKCTFSGGNRTFVFNDNTASWYLLNHMNIKFLNNIIENNIWSYNDLRLMKLVLDKYYQVEMKGNIFRNNFVETGLHISKTRQKFNGSITISENRFLENNFSLSTIEVQSHVTVKLHKNIFKTAFDHECIVVAPEFDISYSINATYNYWGTVSAKRVVKKVCSFDKDMGKSYVWYLPFYKDDDLIETIAVTHDTLNLSGSIGGEIIDDVTLSKSEFPDPIRIDRSIMIRERASVNVEAGVVLLFENNRGIYVQGSLKLLGGETSVVLESAPDVLQWYGVMVNSSSVANKDKTLIYNSRLKQTSYGLVLYSHNVEIKRSEISNSTSQCLTIYQDSQHRIYDMELSRIENCSDHGIRIVGDGITTVSNIKINVTKIGIGLSTGHGSVEIRSINISESRNAAVIVSFWKNTRSGNVTVDSCFFFKCSKGVAVSSNNYADHNMMKISRNTFTDISTNALSVVLPRYRYYYANRTTNRTVDINLNTFQNSCGVAFETWNNVNLTFHDNVISNAFCAEETPCFLNAYANGDTRYTAARKFDISTNMFQNITCKCLAQLKDQSLSNLAGSLVYNQMLDISASESVIVLDALYINVSSNIFDNPDTPFDVYSYKRGWTGETCMEYDCAGVNRCYGNGECTGPNTCKCHEGWSGTLCIVASCINVNNCSGHGFCARPNKCTCAVNFTGYYCSLCVPLHWGSQCRPCPNCQHGTCNLGYGLCECESDNWSGYLCDKCSETFSGPECLPLIKILDIVPNQGLDKGGNPVHVWGNNFPNTSQGAYTCKFGTVETNGTWLAWNNVVCLAPQQQEGMVTLEISTDGVEYTNDKMMYFFYASCPPGSCGRNFNQPRGQCLFGGCSCFLPWTGDNCDKELLAPVIIKPADIQTVEEAEHYSFQLILTQGSAPVLWSLLQGPPGMTIDDRTGLVSWKYAYARSRAYTIEARAKNIIGKDTVTWNLNVHISYSVAVECAEPSGVLSVPRPVEIYGTVTFSNTHKQSVVPIDIIVTSARTGREIVIRELTDPLAPTTFKATYYPRPDDAGEFIANVRHPGATAFAEVNVTWSVLGMRCEPSSVSVDEKILSDDGIVTINDISSLVNVGNGVVEDISAEVDGLPGAFIRKSGDTKSSKLVLPNLAVSDNVEVDLVITNAAPLSGVIYVVFSTAEGTSTRLRVYVKLSIQKPVLIFDPPSFRENIVRGNIRVFDIQINNTGEVAANGVVVSLPDDPRLSVVSFTVMDLETASEKGITIPLGGAALLSIAITTEKTATLGEMSGIIYINSELSSTPFSYRFFITTLQKFNATFIVKDEYTYFASGSPLVSNAKVRLVNPRRGYSETMYTTNKTGYVVFEDVYEDQYSLYAEADGHSSYGTVIRITSDTSEQDIFLQRVAVRYTWTAEPTTVEDVYTIQLESTFETYVPMPVVTIEPAKVNTIPLELEETDTIDFNITNHGLIRADNVRFTLPTAHPYLNFEVTVDFIGSVAANTSIIVPVKATLKNRVKRNAAALAVCGLALLYDYDCGGTQTRGLDVTLTREYPGRPPLPCGLGGGGGGVSYSGGGSGTGSGSSMTHNPTTPLSCDCAKTLIKSCVLAYHPIAGCTVAVADIGTSYSRSGGDFILGTLNAILGLADTAFACVFGVVCSLCGLFYTTIRCVIDVAFNCDGARRRREIGSDVVNNMLTTAKSMNNFLYMMSEILGDEGMYNLETAWYPAFKKTVGEDSELGTLLSKDEATTVLDSLTEQASRTNLSIFLERWNNTAAAWENGKLTELEDTSRVIRLNRLTHRIEQYLNDVESAVAKGFDSIFDEFDHATNAYKTAEQQQSTSSGGSQKDEGVCARVRVNIIQELVLTRDAFNARLEIENGESSDLESINVEIQIKPTFGTGELKNDKFSVGKPTLIGINAVDGTGTLGKDLSGSAEWLIIPYSNAAPEDDTQYDIGGRLSYSVCGSEFSVPLLPDTITVKPNPSLVVHYFHEKYVRGDDALTPEIEPIVPFSLAVSVMNNGYGVARALKITSGQPEIIENEKGLFITFKIIGAQLGNNPVSPFLAVNFGDISSFETKTARWLMTSTLMGTFYNYSATFQNINPLGDPQLSLLDEFGYHELIHLVRIESDEDDDGLDDFLVNDLVDDEGMPDKLYNSANGTDIVDVYTANVTHVQVAIYDSAKNYKFVTLTVKTNTSVWFFARKENTFTSPEPAENEYLLHAQSSDGRELLVDKNVWQTTHSLDAFYLHIFDYAGGHSIGHENSEVELDYFLVYGPRNMYAPRFNASSYSATISKSRTVGFEIITINAYDIDKDKIDVKFKEEYITLFNINAKSESSAVITVNETPMKPGLIILEIIAKDSGIPPRSAYTNVTIRVTDTKITDTTPGTTVTDLTPSPNVTINATISASTTVTSSAYTTVSTSSQNITTRTVSSTSTLTTSANITDSTMTTVSHLTELTSKDTINTTISGTMSTTEGKSQQTTVSSSTKISFNAAALFLLFILATFL